MITAQTNQPARRGTADSSSPQSPQLPTKSNIDAMPSKSESSAVDATATPLKEMLQKNKKWRKKSVDAASNAPINESSEIDLIKDLFDASSIKEDFQTHLSKGKNKKTKGKNENSLSGPSIPSLDEDELASQFAEFNQNLTPKEKKKSPRKSKRKSPRSNKKQEMWQMERQYADYSTNAQGAAILASLGSGGYPGMGYGGGFGDSPTEMSSSYGPYEENGHNYGYYHHGGSAAAAAAEAYQYYHYPQPAENYAYHAYYYPYYAYVPEYYAPPQWNDTNGADGEGCVGGDVPKSEVPKKKLNADAPSFVPGKVDCDGAVWVNL